MPIPNPFTLTLTSISLQPRQKPQQQQTTPTKTRSDSTLKRKALQYYATWTPAKTRRATKAAIALRELILEPSAGSESLSPSTRTTTLPRLREKDVERLRTQLLKPSEAGAVIQQARTLPVRARQGVEPMRAVCLDCGDGQAEQLIRGARQRHAQEKHLAEHRFSTIKSPPLPLARLPVLLSLLQPKEYQHVDTTIPLGLFLPASAMSLHRPLAGALPSAETLRRGFDALLNAESKVYLYEGPSHAGISPPVDRLSIYTYWWGFELALPPPTLEYLSRAKQISISVLNLLSIVVYAVPGGTRELAPFVGVLSRFIETEWAVLKTQDKGRGVVCGATW
ncbi:hypothetical protein BCR39DRAFT_519394 [Naematelia encephala]|uniref:Uncharacterized protein n=1 Tax=Naematelia encephala TaxID=71784 RepID=A0A1Y2BF67_9TREE|nr:hypothetical protein BCR39DRAFT_519394 [Naematelia encephala]